MTLAPKVLSARERLEVDPDPPLSHEFVGIAMSTLGLQPINGLRHPREGRGCGWFLWCGTEWSDADDFFSPMHVSCLNDTLPAAVPYLSLPPGYRFMVDDRGYEDVWADAALLEIGKSDTDE